MPLLYLLSGQTQGSAPTVGCMSPFFKVTLAFRDLDALGGMQKTPSAGTPRWWGKCWGRGLWVVS
jgi:hypothetical protein